MTTASQRLDLAQRRLAAGDAQGAHHLCLEALADNREDDGAWFLLGMIAADHGNPAKAIELFTKAAALAPRTARYLAQLGRVLIALNHRPEASSAAERALDLEPQDALTLDTIGVTFTRLGDHARAVVLFELAVSRHPNHAGFWYNLAASRQFSGQFEGAAQAYRRALDLDPKLHRAWSALVGLERQDPGANSIETLTVLFGEATEADAQLHLGHALAKSCEDLGQWDQSLDWLRRAKTGRRAAIAHDPAGDVALFQAAAMGAKPKHGHASRRPIFVVGLPRTGTTLVDRILSSHNDVVSVGETTHFAMAVKRLAATPSNLVLDPQTLLACGDIDGATLGRAYLESVADLAKDSLRFVDKLPLNCFYAGLINAALPDAMIICLRRNPIDAALSNYRQLFATQFSYYNHTYDLAQTGAYVAGFERLVAHWRGTLPADRYIEVAYEDLVADQEGQSRRLLAACGLAWDPACLRFQDNTAPIATASSVQVRSPIYASSVGRWRRYGAGLDDLRTMFGES